MYFVGYLIKGKPKVKDIAKVYLCVLIRRCRGRNTGTDVPQLLSHPHISDLNLDVSVIFVAPDNIIQYYQTFSC